MAYNPIAGIYQAQPNPGSGYQNTGAISTFGNWLTNMFRPRPRRNPFSFSVVPGSVTQGVNQPQVPQPLDSPGGRFGQKSTSNIGLGPQPLPPGPTGPVQALNLGQLEALMPIIQQQASSILANDPSKVGAWNQLRAMFPGLGSQNNLLQQLIPGLQFQQGAPSAQPGYQYVKSGRTSAKGLPIYQKVPV